MIYSQLTGGLGNQMYGYAMGYALAKRYSDELTVDLSAYPHEPMPYMLDRFNITAHQATMSPAKHRDKLSRMIARAGRILQSRKYGPCRWMKEDLSLSRNRYYDYDFSHKASLYIEGYWQSYRYFDAYRDELRSEFTPRDSEIGDTARQLIDDCSGSDSVAIHIRRGDYEAGWCIGDDYYNQAIALIREKVDHPFFYIFCTDEKCGREYQRRLEDAVYVTKDYKLSDVEEFQVMRSCHHLIIGNSTYSFWAAYLSEHADKQVVAPVLLHWGAEYYPQGWNKIEIKRKNDGE